MSLTPKYRPSRGDRGAIWVFIVAGAAIAIAITVSAVMRISELLSGGKIQVAARFADQSATAALGPNGHDVEVGLDRAILSTEVPAFSVWSGVIAQVVLAVTFIAVILCLILLSRRILRGQIFGRTSTRLVVTAGMAGLLGIPMVYFFNNMLANGAIAQVSSPSEVDSVAISFDFFPFVIAAFAVAIICTVFVVGERLQRETEGLV